MKSVAIIAVATIALLAASGCDAGIPEGSTLPEVDPNHDPRWTLYRDAFPVRDNWLTGPVQLIATGDGCFLGVGRDSSPSGSVPAIWTTTGDCSAPKLDRPEGVDELLLGNIASLGSASTSSAGGPSPRNTWVATEGRGPSFSSGTAGSRPRWPSTSGCANP